MNAKELYLAIGKIDDDLILEAGRTAEKKKKRVIMKLTAMAVGICLLAGGGYAGYMDHYVVWNQEETGFVGKAAVPVDGIIKTLTKEEGEAYYGIPALPEDLGGDLQSTGISFIILKDTQGKVIYDRNLIRYESSDGLKGINLTLSRISAGEEENGKMKKSHIRQKSVMLTETDLGNGNWLLEAKWETNGTSFCADADGMDKTQFLSLLRELIR